MGDLMLDVSVIIVNYNTKELTYNCLKSVFEMTKNIRFEVIVSDNGSTDGSIEMIKKYLPLPLVTAVSLQTSAKADLVLTIT